MCEEPSEDVDDEYTAGVDGPADGSSENKNIQNREGHLSSHHAG